MNILSRADEILLLAIWRLKDNAYGVTIIKEIAGRIEKKLTFGALWVALDILHKKGFVEKKMADPTPERGGRSKIFYTLTDEGLGALQRTRELNEALWEDIPKVMTIKEK